MSEGILTSVKSDAKDKLQAARIAGVWDGMKDAGIDALVVCGRGLLTQYGYLEYVLGFCPLVRTTYAVVLPDRKPILVTPTGSDAWYAKMALGDIDVRVAGQGDVISKQDSLPRVIGEIIEESRVASGKIGVVGLKHIMPVGDFDELREALPDANFVDADHVVAQAKAVKFKEELEEVKRACAIADAGLEVFRERAAVGVTGWELWGDMQREVHRRGSREVLIMVSNDPYFNSPPRDEPLQAEDLVITYVEITGPNGFWVEKASLFDMGAISDAKRDIAELCLASHEAAIQRITTDYTSADVAAAIEETVEGQDIKFGIWHGHGVGVDHDTPVLTAADKTPFVEDMVIALHPNFTNNAETVGASIADTFIVQGDGQLPIRGSKIDQKLYRIDREV